MRSVMAPHVYQLLRLCSALEGRLHYALRLSHKSYHRAVGGLARIYVQHFYPFDGGYGGDDSVDYRPVASLAVIRDAFDYSLHTAISLAYKDTNYFDTGSPRRR